MKTVNLNACEFCGKEKLNLTKYTSEVDPQPLYLCEECELLPNNPWKVYQNIIDEGLMFEKTSFYKNSHGKSKIITRIFITPKGMAKLAQIFSKEKIIK